MNRLAIVLILWILSSVSCAAPEIRHPTQVVVPGQISTPGIPTSEAQFIGDGGLITEQPCASPCFLGIQIGETHLDQVVLLLEKNGVSSCIKDVDNVSCGLSIYIGAQTSNLIIDSIGYSPETPISMDTVVQKYGNPDLIQIFPSDIPEEPQVSAQLFWDSINMRINLPEIDGHDYLVENTTNIEWVTFFDENLYSGLITSGYTQNWNGYRVYTSTPQ